MSVFAVIVASCLPAKAATTIVRGPLAVLARGASGGCTPGTNTLTVNLLAQFSSTANVTFYESPSFTPSSNATIFMIESFSPTGTDTLTNTGTTQLTWWPAATTNYDGGAHTHAVWVSQLPQGTAPFAMTLVQKHGSGTGTATIIAEVTGADQTAAYGTNAIVQAVAFAVAASANPTNKFSAPGNNGFNTLLFSVGDDINSGTDSSANLNWTELWETNYNTPAAGCALYYTNAASSLMTTATNTATSRDWATIAIEVKAGTNCLNCDFSTAPAFVQVCGTNQTQLAPILNYTNAMTAGNLSVLAIWQVGDTGTITTVTNNLGDVYTLATNLDSVSSAESLYVYYKANVQAAQKITAVQSSSLACKMIAHEYSGLTALEAVNIATDSSISASSGFILPSVGRVMLFEACADFNGFTITPSDGSTTRFDSSDHALLTSDRAVTCAQNYRATFGFSNSEIWVAAICAFK